MQRFLIALVVFALAGCATRKAAEPVRVAAKPPAAQRVPEASKPEPRTVPEPTVFEATGSDVQQFIAEVAQRRGIPASDIEKLIAQGRHQPRIIEIMTRPAEGVLRWYEYSEKLVTAERMDAGRWALLQRGDNEVGPYQSPMEYGMQHFHEWYRQRLDL